MLQRRVESMEIEGRKEGRGKVEARYLEIEKARANIDDDGDA